MTFTVTSHETQPATVRVTAAGEIDMSTTGRLGQAITTAIRTANVTTVHVDLAAVTFLDATGITALIRGRNLATRHGGAYHVMNAHGSVRRVLDITDTLDLLTRPPA